MPTLLLILVWCIVGLNVITGFCSGLAFYPQNGGCLWGDIFYLPALWHDASLGELNWFWWSTPAARFFWPDTPIFVLFKSFLPGHVLPLLIQSFLNLILFSGGAFLLLTRLFPNVSKRQLLMLLALALAFVTLPGVFPVAILGGIVFPAFHSGILWWTVWTLLIAVYAWQTQKAYLWWWVLAMCLVGIFSDMLFVALCLIGILPLIFNSNMKASTKGLWICLLIVLGGAILSLCNVFIPIAPLHHLTVFLPGSYFWQDSLLKAFRDFSSPIGLGFIIGHLLILGWVIRSWKRWSIKERILAFVMACVVYLPFSASVLGGRYDNMENWRYFPLFFISVVFLSFWLIRASRLIYIPIVATFLVSLVGAFANESWREINYPWEARVLDDLSKLVPLKNGLSSYYLSKPVTELSRNGLVLCALDKDRATPYLKVSDLAWFGFSYMPSSRGTGDFNFIVMNTLNEKAVRARFGEPSTIFDIPGPRNRRLVLWFYDYNLASQIEKDSSLWGLIYMRLRQCPFFLGESDINRIGAYFLQNIGQQSEPASK